jgi:hypothetical protein
MLPRQGRSSLEVAGAASLRQRLTAKTTKLGPEGVTRRRYRPTVDVIAEAERQGFEIEGAVRP